MNCYEEYSEHFNTCDDDEIIKEFPREYYCGNYVIMWEVYNDNEECLSDYHTGLDKYFNLSEIADEWGKKMYKLTKGLEYFFILINQGVIFWFVLRLALLAKLQPLECCLKLEYLGHSSRYNLQVLCKQGVPKDHLENYP